MYKGNFLGQSQGHNRRSQKLHFGDSKHFQTCLITKVCLLNTYEVVNLSELVAVLVQHAYEWPISKTTCRKM